MTDPLDPAPLASLALGQTVWHRVYGRGTVLLIEGVGNHAVAQIDCGPRGNHWLPIPNPRLFDTPPMPSFALTRGLVHSGRPARACRRGATRPHRHVLDPTFTPPELQHADAPPPHLAAWLRTLAARRAAHLRVFAERLLARGDDAAPLRCELLLPIFRGEGVVPVQLPPTLRGLNDAATDAAGQRRVLWKRVSQHVTRGLTFTDEGTPWVLGFCEDRHPEPFYALRSWAASRTDLRFGLTRHSAPALLAYAGQIEAAQAIPAQPALWLARPTGWLHGEALALAKLAFGRAGRAIQPHVSHGEGRPHSMSIDLLRPPREAPQDPTAAAPGADFDRLQAWVAECAVRRGVRWTQARLQFRAELPACHPDDLWCRVTLETHPPFHRVDAWINDAFDLAGHC